MLLRFSKMQSLSNDFMVIDGVTQTIQLSAKQIQQWGDRHQGVGFDQLLIVEPPLDPQVDFLYRIFNSDGTEALQCGNGLRCLAQFIHHQKLSIKKNLKIQTKDRLLTVNMESLDYISADMGVPELTPLPLPAIKSQDKLAQHTLEIDNKKLTLTTLSMGNLHAVLDYTKLGVSDQFWESAIVTELGHKIQMDPCLKAGYNIGFFELISPSDINLRVYERNVGETMACGSGACAAVVATILDQLTDTCVKVHVRGGQLDIAWKGMGEVVLMKGPATTVFEGSLTY